MTIAEAREKSKGLLAKVPRDILIISLIILASSASFGLGYLAGKDAGQGSENALLAPSQAARGTTGEMLASKGGTKYYFPSCTGAGGISDGNKVWFISAEAAEAAGYTRATNCTAD